MLDHTSWNTFLWSGNFSYHFDVCGFFYMPLCYHVDREGEWPRSYVIKSECHEKYDLYV